jgi:hypothetical protein
MLSIHSRLSCISVLHKQNIYMKRGHSLLQRIRILVFTLVPISHICAWDRKQLPHIVFSSDLMQKHDFKLRYFTYILPRVGVWTWGLCWWLNLLNTYNSYIWVSRIYTLYRSLCSHTCKIFCLHWGLLSNDSQQWRFFRFLTHLLAGWRLTYN